jgi:hypothetical protein
MSDQLRGTESIANKEIKSAGIVPKRKVGMQEGHLGHKLRNSFAVLSVSYQRSVVLERETEYILMINVFKRQFRNGGSIFTGV